MLRCGVDPRGIIAHSDQGVPYAIDLYQQTLRRYGLVPSMSPRGHCTDNATMESFWATLKTELLAGQPHPATRDAAQTAIFEYVEVFYYRKRLHSALGYQTPVDFELNLHPTPKKDCLTQFPVRFFETGSEIWERGRQGRRLRRATVIGFCRTYA